MTELERWMNDHPPLADALTAEETAALRQKVLARRPKPRVLRGWRLAAAAAALCLVAAGAVVLGLFHPMSAANETNALVQKYGEVLDEPLTAEINGHTVSVKGRCCATRTRCGCCTMLIMHKGLSRGIWCGVPQTSPSSRPRKAPLTNGCTQ